MINIIKSKLSLNFTNAQGWKTLRKIVVIESDDWGAIRVSNKNALNSLRDFGLPVEKCNYMMNDALASEEDISALFEILTSFKDQAGNHPIFTANTIVANPDFHKIKESNYEKYFYESFLTTLQNYPNHKNAFELWKKGEENNIFHPQFHGREHLNVYRWMSDLKSNNKETRFAFDLGIFGVSAHVSSTKRESYLAAFDGNQNKEEVVKDGLRFFKDIFGYESKSFIAPNYIWNNSIEEAAFEMGVKYIQGTHVQRLPREKGEKQQIVKHSLGQRNDNKQIYLVRNVVFEPSENQNKDWVNKTLKEIQNAFLWNKPAVISSHRVNYVGFINESNRDKSLEKLNQLITAILKKWPDVEFLSSEQLGNLIE